MVILTQERLPLKSLILRFFDERSKAAVVLARTWLSEQGLNKRSYKNEQNKNVYSFFTIDSVNDYGVHA